MHYNEEWKFCRRICQQNFRQIAALKYVPMETKKVRQMLQGLLESPEDFEAHNKKSVIYLILHHSESNHFLLHGSLNSAIG